MKKAKSSQNAKHNAIGSLFSGILSHLGWPLFLIYLFIVIIIGLTPMHFLLFILIEVILLIFGGILAIIAITFGVKAELKESSNPAGAGFILGIFGVIVNVGMVFLGFPILYIIGALLYWFNTADWADIITYLIT